MTYEPKNFEHLLGLPGFSDTALTTHFKLYQGYVTNTNGLLEKLKQFQQANDLASPLFSEAKRRLGWEFNGMRLHEYHFDAMTKGFTPLDRSSALYQKIEQDFGSYENWEANFRATAAMRGIGWAILYYDQTADKLINVWINEHDQGHLAGCKVLLNLDVFEHAFMLDYGTARADYIAAFMQVIDWAKVDDRFQN